MCSRAIGGARQPAEWAEARRLRRELGLPLKAIAAEVGVSLSSVSLWTRDISISDEQRSRNLSLATSARSKRWAALNRERRLGYQRAGREQARRGDPEHRAGCMLFWAEGAKDRNTCCFANSDPDMVRIMRTFLTNQFGVAAADFRVRLNVYTGNRLSLADIEQHWLRVLELPRSCMDKHTVDSLPTSSSGRRINKLPHGVCTLKVHSTRIVQEIYGAIQEYAEIERPEWLD